MIELSISDTPEPVKVALKDLPLSIGRNPDCDLRLEGAGVWDQHAVLSLESAEGFRLKACPDAVTRVNGAVVDQTRLRNGDCIDLGGVRLHFGFSSTQQHLFRFRERLTFLAVGLLCLVQLLIVYILLP